MPRAKQMSATGDHAHRQAAPEGLAVGDHVGLHAEVLLRTPRGEPEAGEHLVEDQHDAALGADLAQPAQPVGIGGAVGVGVATAVDQRAVGGRRRVRVQRLQRIDDHAGDVAARTQHAQRALVALAQRVGLARGQRVARAGLHVLPPAVVGAGEADQVGAARVVTGETNRLHHRLGARHVERHLVQARNLAQPSHVVGHAGVIGAEHRTELVRPGAALGHALLVEVVAEHVHAVRAGEVVVVVAVEVGDGHARRRLDEAARLHILAQQSRVLIRHPVAAGELHVGHADLSLGRHRDGLGRTLAQGVTQTFQTCATAFGDFGRSTVRVEEAVFAVGIEGDQLGDPLGHAGVTTEGSVFRPRQFKPAFQRGHQRRDHRSSQNIHPQVFVHGHSRVAKFR